MGADDDILEWHWELAGWIPTWKREPDITAIRTVVRKALYESISESHSGPDLKITFFASGLLNKLYTVKLEGSDMVYLMRIPLPVDPWFKTRSEVCTIKTIQGLTNFPLPTIHSYCADNHNELHLEWFLMEMLPDQTLWNLWRGLSMQQKQDVVKNIARLQADLFNAPWSSIGSLGTSNSNPHNDGTAGTAPLSSSSNQDTTGLRDVQKIQYDSLFPLSPVVQQTFALANRVKIKAERGPFFSDHDWIHAWLSMVLQTHEQDLKLSDDEDVREDAEIYSKVAKDLLEVLPKVFPPKEPTSTCLVHDDLNFSNIMIDENGNITGIIDWECVSTLPLWRACQLPKLLVGGTREEKPDPARYADVDDEDLEIQRESCMPMSNNLGKNSLYWEHLLEWEMTTLVTTFMNEMDHLAPEWRHIQESSKIKTEFVENVESVASCIDDKGILMWIQTFKDG